MVRFLSSSKGLGDLAFTYYLSVDFPRYISCGSGNGNPYGLAAVCAVCFPVIFFARIYWPIPPMRNIVFFVTIFLVGVA